MSDVIRQIFEELRRNVINIPIDNDVICIICNEVMINGRCAPCGCRFCLACISKHLNEQNNYCPGETINCTREMILLNVNTHNDYGINRKISQMKVKCPVPNCSYMDEVRNIENHVEICNLNFRTINARNANRNCQVETENRINSLENKLENMLTKINTFDNVMEMLKIDKDAKQNTIWEMETNANNCFNKIKQMDNEITQMRNKFKIHEDPEMRIISCKDWKNMTTPLHKEIQESLSRLNNEIDIMKNKLKEIEDSQNQLKFVIENFKNKFELIKPIAIESISNSTCDSFKIPLKISKAYSWEINKFFSMEKQNLVDSNKIITSDTFYTHQNGYKLHLELNLNTYASGGGTPIYICYRLMEGDYDDYLMWPCKFDVKFDLINPYDNKSFATANLYHDYWSNHPGKRKPDIETFPVGCILAKLEDIFNIKEWRKRDKIVVECTISLNEY